MDALNVKIFLTVGKKKVRRKKYVKNVFMN